MKSIKYILIITVILLLFVFLVTFANRKNQVDYGDESQTSVASNKSESETVTSVTTLGNGEYEQFTLPGETPMSTTEYIPAQTTPAQSTADTNSSSSESNETAETSSTTAQTTTVGGDFMINDDGGEWALYLVNNDNPVSKDFNVDTKTVYTSWMDFKMDVRMADYMIKMIADAKKDGVSLVICSAYRSVDKQTANFDAQVAEYEGSRLFS